MKRFAFAVGLLALGVSAAAPARADFAVARFADGSCRVWTETAATPSDGRFLAFKHRDHWHKRFVNWDAADRAAHLAVAQRRCDHLGWWWM